MTTFFSSDNHFGHIKIIEYSKRPFSSVEKMNEEMIRRWNEVVGPNDLVYHLGDFSFQKRDQAKETLSRLNGVKKIILGNHDRSAKQMLEMGFIAATKELQTIVDGQLVHMSHRPFEGIQYESCVYLNGHVHELWKTRFRSINVGVDQWNFTPQTLKTLMGALP